MGCAPDGFHHGFLSATVAGRFDPVEGETRYRTRPRPVTPRRNGDPVSANRLAPHFARAASLRSCSESGTLGPVFAARVRLIVVVSLVLGAATTVGSASSHAAHAQRRSGLPTVLRLVDRSRRIRLPGGRRIARPVTTYLWYPPPGDGNGPWPLVIFGHGFATTPFRYRRLLGAWAAAGYLVAAPVFPLGNANAPGGPDENDIVNQPRDMSFVITQLLAASASSASPLHGLVERSQIAVAGQSDGAETAFATAYERPWYDRLVRAAVVLSGAELGRHVGLVLHTPPLLAVQGGADRINPPVYSLDLFRATVQAEACRLSG